MASLKEIKGRISSVKSTLKITSAMKLVASAKLHKAQNAIANMLPYEQKLRSMLQLLLASTSFEGGTGFRGMDLPLTSDYASGRVAIVAFSSNSSLCGGFNANVIREVKARIGELKAAGESVEVVAVGRKVAEAMKKAGYPSAADWSELVAHTSYAEAESLARTLREGFDTGLYSRVELIYNHFVSTGTQRVTRDVYLPFTLDVQPEAGDAPVGEDIIIEPSPEEMLAELMPRVRSLRIYTVALDSVAAEHAARTVAMQTATDNGENILQELTLEYNKGRQQKITSEILDIVGGSMQ